MRSQHRGQSSTNIRATLRNRSIGILSGSVGLGSASLAAPMGSEFGTRIGRLVNRQVPLMFHLCNSFRCNGRLTVHGGLHLCKLSSHRKEGLDQRTILVREHVGGTVAYNRVARRTRIVTRFLGQCQL